MSRYDRYGEEIYDAELVDEPDDATAPAAQDAGADQDWPETITVDEIGTLLDEAVARDQRTTGEADVLAWYQDLNLARITYAEASRAMSEYYVKVWPGQPAERRFRATPGAIIEIVGRERKARLATDWKYIPASPDESGAEFVERFDRQRDAVAAGLPHPTHIGQLKPHPELEERIKGEATRRLLPREIAELAAADLARKPREIVAALKDRRNPALTVPCPRCGVSPGAKCHDGRGQDLGGGRRVHPSRTEAYAVSSYPCETCGAEPGGPCVERSPGSLEVRPYFYGVHKLRIEATADQGQARAA